MCCWCDHIHRSEIACDKDEAPCHDKQDGANATKRNDSRRHGRHDTTARIARWHASLHLKMAHGVTHRHRHGWRNAHMLFGCQDTSSFGIVRPVAIVVNRPLTPLTRALSVMWWVAFVRYVRSVRRIGINTPAVNHRVRSPAAPSCRTLWGAMLIARAPGRTLVLLGRDRQQCSTPTEPPHHPG